MALRMLEIVVPDGSVDALKGVFRDGTVLGGPWEHDLLGERRSVRVLIDAAASGRLVDAIHQRCEDLDGYQLVLSPVQAALPAPEEQEEEKKPRAVRSAFGQRSTRSGGSSIAREELRTDVEDMTQVTRVYIATVILSTVVAAVGLLADNTAAVIGAMVIAPLLGPNVGLALATTLADGRLFRRGLMANGVGVLIALGLAAGIALIPGIEVHSQEVLARTHVGFGDVALALAAGAAGTLALTTGVPMTLVGVMVAVALLPPTTVVGLMLGDGRLDLAGKAGLLLATNLICINLAGSITFRVMGIRPATWWEAERAKRASLLGMVVMGLLLAAVLVLLWRGIEV